MRNISTDALHPWDRSMWTDSPTPLHEQFGMTAIEARLDRWYFDGPGDNGDDGSSGPSGGYGVDDDPGISMTADQAEAAAAAADAAAAAGATADQQQDAVDRASADMQDMSVDDFTQGMGVDPDKGLTDAQYDAVKGAAIDSLYDTNYNAFAELAGIGEYDEFGNRKADYFDEQVAKADTAIAAAIEKNAKEKGRDVEVSVDPQGQFSYSPGPTGSIADVAAVAGSQIAQGFADLAPMASPTALAASMVDPTTFDLGLDLAPRDLAATATQEAIGNRQGTFDTVQQQDLGPPTMSLDEAVAQGLATVGRADPEAIQTQIDRFEKQNEFQDLLSATLAERDAISPEITVTDLPEPQQFTGPEVDPDAVGFQEAYDRNLQAAAEGAAGPGSDIQFAQLAEDVDLLGDLIGSEDQGGDNVVEEAKPKPSPETEPPVEERTPRPFEILPFAASTPFTPRTQYGQVVPVTRTQFARPGGIADLQTQLAILNRRLFT